MLNFDCLLCFSKRQNHWSSCGEKATDSCAYSKAEKTSTQLKKLRPDCWFTEIIWLDDAFKASQESFCLDSVMSLHKVALHCIKTSLKHLALKLACSCALVLYVLHSCNTTVACLACRPAARER